MKRDLYCRLAAAFALSTALFVSGCGGSDGGTQTTADDGNSNTGGTTTPTVTGAANGQVSIHPEAGPAGSTVAISGRGFTAACRATLHVDSIGGEQLGGVDIANGEFDIQVVIPEASPVGTLLIVGDLLEATGQDCTQSTGTNFETAFEVTGTMPIIVLASLEGRPGATVAVDGRGFCGAAACSAATLLIDGQVAARDIAVASDGTFSTDVIVPAIDAAGAVAVVALQTGAGGETLRAFGELVVTVRPNTDTTAIP